jgi:peptide chain release factor subunit 1
LRELLKEEKVIGILSLDTTEAGLGIVSGSKFEVVDVATSGVSGKHRAGGQSARRFERMREMELTEYFNRVARHAAKIFLEEYRIEGLILSGPGPTKDDFLKGRYLDYRLQDAIIATLDTSYAGSEGVRDTLEKSEKILQDIRVMEERRLVQRFLQEVSAANGLATYGANDVVTSLKRGNVENILISEVANLHRVVVTCKRCGTSSERIIPRDMLVIEKQRLIASACSNCSSTEFELSERDIVEYLSDLALSSGAKVEVVSSKTEEGAMLKSFGGVAAILRYR